MGSRFLESLRDCWDGSLQISSVTVLPLSCGESALQVYNTVLALAFLHEEGDGSLIHQNRIDLQLKSQNSMIAEAVGSLSLPENSAGFTGLGDLRSFVFSGNTKFAQIHFFENQIDKSLLGSSRGVLACQAMVRGEYNFGASEISRLGRPVGWMGDRAFDVVRLKNSRCINKGKKIPSLTLAMNGVDFYKIYIPKLLQNLEAKIAHRAFLHHFENDGLSKDSIIQAAEILRGLADIC